MLLFFEDNLRNKTRKRGKKTSSSRVSGVKSVRQHQDSYDVRLAEQTKQKKKNSPGQVAMDRARRKAESHLFSNKQKAGFLKHAAQFLSVVSVH